MGWYFLDKHFRLYLPNKQAIDQCLPSGGNCSVDGFANLEISGQFGLVCLMLTIAGLGFALWLFRRATGLPVAHFQAGFCGSLRKPPSRFQTCW